MTGTIVGSVGVSLVPNAEGWHERAAEIILPQAEELGKEFGEAFLAAWEETTGGAEFTPEMNPGPAEAEITGLEEKLDELAAHDMELGANLNATEAVAEAESLQEALGQTQATAESLGATLAETADAATAVESAAADASVALGGVGSMAGEAEAGIIALTNRERELLAGILELNPGMDLTTASLEAQGQAAQEAALQWDEYTGALSDLPAEWLQIRDALFELQQGESMVVGRGGGGALNLLTGGEADQFVVDQSKYTNIKLIDDAMVQAADDANQLAKAEAFAGVSFDDAGTAATQLRGKLLGLGLSEAEATAGALAVADAVTSMQAAQERAGAFQPLTGSSLIDAALSRSLADSSALKGAQEALGIEEGTVAEQTAAANARLLEMGFSEDQAAAGALALTGSLKAQAAAMDDLAAATAAEDVANKGFRGNFVTSLVGGVLGDPLTWILALAAGVGFLGYEMVRATDASGNLGKTTAALDEGLAKQDKAVGFNLAGYRKYIGTLEQTKNATQAIYNLPQGEGTFVGRGLAQTNKDLQTAQVHYANLTSNIERFGHQQGLDTIQTMELAKAAGVNARQLAATGQQANNAMSKMTAYAEKERDAASSTAAFSSQMEIANGLAGSLSTRVQALGAAMGDLFNPTLDMINTTNQLDNDMATLKTDLAASGDKVGTFTQAQRDAGTQMAQTVKDAILNAQAIKEVTGSSDKAAAPLMAMRAELESLGVKGGEVGTVIRDLDTAIAALKDKTVNISVLVHEAFSSTGGSPMIPGTLQHMFAGGGVVPGYSPGVDSRTARVSPGESIMVPEWTAAHGKDWVDSQNAYYSSRRPGRGPASTGHYANGGVISDSLKGNGDTFQVFLGLLGPSAGADVRSSDQKAAASAAVTVAKEFASGHLSTPAQIEAAGRLALKDLAKYYTGPHEHELAGIIEKQTGVLAEMSRVQARIQATIQGMRQASSAEIQSLQSFSDLSSMHFSTNAQGVQEPTGQGIKTQLHEKLMQLRKFNQLIGRMHHMGVAPALIEQAIQLGPEDGSAYMEAILSGGTRLIGTLNRDEREIGISETNIGHRTADIQFGQSITKGWLASLDKDKEQLAKHMRELGDEIAREMLKALGGKLNVGGGGLAALDKSVALGLKTLEGIAGHGDLRRSDVNQIEAFLHHIGAAETGIMTKRQGDTIISLLRSAPHATGSATANGISSALDRTARGAALSGRYSTRTRNT